VGVLICNKNGDVDLESNVVVMFFVVYIHSLLCLSVCVFDASC